MMMLVMVTVMMVTVMMMTMIMVTVIMIMLVMMMMMRTTTTLGCVSGIALGGCCLVSKSPSSSS